MRALNPAAAALQARAVAGEQIPVVPLLYMGLPVPQRLALCGVPLVWGGYTWEPCDGQLDNINNEAGEPSGLKISLPAVNPGDIAMAVDDDIEGSAVTLYLAWVDPDTAAVADAMPVWAGELDMPGWQDGPEAVAHYTAEHRAAIAMRPRVQRYTNDEQQRLYPGDTALNFDPATDAAPLVWPAASFFKVQE